MIGFFDDRDSRYGTSLKDYLEMLRLEGFEQIYEKDFDAAYPSLDEDVGTCIEKNFIFWQPEGVLLNIASIARQSRINQGKFFYNWKPNPELLRYRSEDDYVPVWSDFTSSGHFVRESDAPVWCGYHYCLEKFRYALQGLRMNGTFVTPWLDVPYMQLQDYVYWRGYNIDAMKEAGIDVGEDSQRIDREIVESLPEYVRKQILPTQNERFELESLSLMEI